jgi:GNAT superfamily N-acetyltransferase
LPALARLATEGISFLIERYEPERADGFPMDPEERMPVLRHILATGALFVAEVEGSVAGFASAIIRDGVWHLAQLFVGEGSRGRGLGGSLIDAALEWGSGTRAFTVISSRYPFAETLYMRRSMFPVWSQLEAHGIRVEPPPMPEGFSELREQDQDWVDDLDRDARGAARSEDHVMFREHATALALRRARRPAGYIYVWPQGRIGPAAAADAADVSILVRAGCHVSGERSWCSVPSTNWGALKELVSLGFRTAGSAQFMASRPWPDGSRYLSSGGALA